MNQLTQLNILSQRSWRAELQFAAGLLVTVGGAAVLLSEILRLFV